MAGGLMAGGLMAGGLMASGPAGPMAGRHARQPATPSARQCATS